MLIIKTFDEFDHVKIKNKTLSREGKANSECQKKLHYIYLVMG